MKARHILLTNRFLRDLNPLVTGLQQCDPGHRFGPHIRKYTLLHYVISGKGTLYARGQSFSIGPGQVFLILPGEVTTYEADHRDPWHYRWIGFDGNLSTRFQDLEPVFSPPESLFANLFRLAGDPEVTEYRLSGALLELYAALFSPVGGNPHVRKVESYIRTSYMHPIRVEQIAEALNLDRRYLSRLFKEKTGCSVQEFLIRTRMEAGAELLRKGRSVSEAAQLSGYEDITNFSKMFKKHYGRSPAAFSKGK